MRIAYLVSQYPAINHTFILREIRQLRSLGFEIPVISVRPSDRPFEQLTKEEREEASLTKPIKAAPLWRIVGAHIAALISHPRGYVGGVRTAVRLGRGHARNTLSHLLYFMEAVVAGRWMECEGLSHFHVHFSSTVGLLVTQIFPLTMSITLHGPDEFTDPAGFHLREKVAASLFVCTISHYGRSQVMRFCDRRDWAKIEAVHLGVDTRAFVPRAFRDCAGPFEIACVGRLAPVKGQHILIEAIARLVRQGRHVRLRLVGDGPERAGLEARAAALHVEDHVVFEGWLNQDQIRAVYERADVFALASFAEGIPVVLMEAMAMGIPCVATSVTGVPELIRNEVDGLLVTPSDPSALAEAIGRLMDDPALRRRLQEAGRKRVTEEFDLERNCRQLEKLFRTRLAVSNSRRAPSGPLAGRNITRRQQP
jgi:glycosyltransferase involved in cell wall biosynthesis